MIAFDEWTLKSAAAGRSQAFACARKGKGYEADKTQEACWRALASRC